MAQVPPASDHLSTFKIFNWEKRNRISLKTTVLKQALKFFTSSFKAVYILATH